MTNQEIAEMRTELAELRKENGDLKEQIMVKDGKEKELRALISFLNKLGPKPENMLP